MTAHGKIVDLRALLAERFPSIQVAPSTVLSTGLSPLDAVTNGGLPKGAVTEFISPSLSAGSASLTAGLLHVAQRSGFFLALIDGSDSFDPHSVADFCLPHLLWLRCHTTRDAMKAADLLLRDGNFPLVVLDLVLNPVRDLRKIPQTNWYRLQRLVETTSTAFVVFTRSGIVSSAQLKFVLENTWNLSSLSSGNPLSNLQLRLQRSHGAHAEIARLAI